MDLRFLAVIFLVIAIMEAIGKLLKKARLAEAEEEQPQEPPRPRDPLAEVFRDLRLGQLGDDAAKPAARLVREAVERAVPMAEDRGEAVPEAASGVEEPSPTPSPVGHPRERRPPPGPAPTPVRRSREPRPIPEPAPPMSPAPGQGPRPEPAPAAAVRQRTPSHEPVPAMAALRRRAGSDGIAAAPTPRSPQRRPWNGAVAAYTSPTALRHLVVAREVLGPPVALRAEGDPLER
ncbi:MAG: hypothetical protein OXG58_10125 [Gemmatimonadetes bacterium]|nr:hypothetical protein [Gemmatimonadota bacterium]MCY3943598.1 hypothetical protein [Gemmatimonadota bacterium]